MFSLSLSSQLVAVLTKCFISSDTGDLALRIGIHSGTSLPTQRHSESYHRISHSSMSEPATQAPSQVSSIPTFHLHRIRHRVSRLSMSLGGVIRGANARYQLFGDTVNTAARMESNGIANAIQMSQDTVNLLEAAGKSTWYTPRKDKVYAKGKGEMQTYWLLTSHECDVQSNMSSSHDTDTASEDPHGIRDFEDIVGVVTEKTKRLVDWNSEILAKLLTQIVTRRKACGHRQVDLRELAAIEQAWLDGCQLENTIDEVREIIPLPVFNASTAQDCELVELDQTVKQQLKHWVQAVASLYRGNSFQ